VFVYICIFVTDLSVKV